jgi:hypothetical protein
MQSRKEEERLNRVQEQISKERVEEVLFNSTK